MFGGPSSWSMVSFVNAMVVFSTTNTAQPHIHHHVALRQSWRRTACVQWSTGVRHTCHETTIRSRAQHIDRHNTELVWQSRRRGFQRAIRHVAASEHWGTGWQFVWRRSWRCEACIDIALSLTGRNINLATATANTNGRFLQLVFQTRRNTATEHGQPTTSERPRTVVPLQHRFDTAAAATATATATATRRFFVSVKRWHQSLGPL